MIEHGIIIGGKLLPGTEQVTRDPAAWWGPGDRQTMKRAPIVDLLFGHWTGGEAGDRDPDGPGVLTEYDDDGPRVFRVMRSRQKNGRPMKVSIHFVIGACAPNAPLARIWQTADPGRVAACHVGAVRNIPSLNARSIGVEVVSAGLPGPGNVRGRRVLKVPLVGKTRDVLEFYPGQLAAFRWLADQLSLDADAYADAEVGVDPSDARARLLVDAGIKIPRRVPRDGDFGVLADRRLSRIEADHWTGALEHFCSPATTKLDGGGMLLGELARAGWRPTAP